MMVMSLRNGSSGARLPGDRSNARPNSAGAHMFFLMPNAVLPAEPCTISIAARRILPRAACAEARAGTIASRNGSAIVTPAALRTVRRDNCFCVRYMGVSHPRLKSTGHTKNALPLTLDHFSGAPLIVTFVRRAHPERNAIHHAQHVSRQAIALLVRIAHDRANRRHVGVFEPAAQAVGHQALGEA